MKKDPRRELHYTSTDRCERIKNTNNTTLATSKRKNKKCGLEEVLSKFNQKPVSQEKTIMDILMNWLQTNQ